MAIPGVVFYGGEFPCTSLFFCAHTYIYAFRASDGVPVRRLTGGDEAPTETM
jgi:hypothetical protein